MKTVSVINTDFGIHVCSQSVSEKLSQFKFTRKNWPDRRYKEARILERYFALVGAAKKREFLGE